MICKRCQTELQEGSRFCPTCGALQPMICPTCGAESRPGSKTCSGCGKKLPLVDRPDKLVYTRRPRRTGELVAMFFIVLGALVVLGAAVLLLTKTITFEKANPPAQQEEQTLPEEIPAPEEEVPEEIPVEPAEPETPAEQPEEEQPAEEEQPSEEEVPAEEEPAAEEEPPVEEQPAEQWYFADSSQRLLTEADIAGLSSEDLRFARNEIYARHGRRFNSADLQAYFNSCSWYKPTIDAASFTDDMLNEIELANVRFLKAAE